MISINQENIRTDSIKNLYQPFGVEADVLRLDLIHPVISGNKWFKLKFYLEKASKLNKKGILTFGGAYSNHIIATAEACRLTELSCIGIIRGEQPKVLSHTLRQAETAGMSLHYISREMYRHKHIPEEIATEDWLVVDEGGYGIEGVLGAATIMANVVTKYEHIILAAGTGTTLAGIVAAGTGSKCIGISVLKGNASLEAEVNALLAPVCQNQFEILHDFHFGGYAKYNTALLQFMNDWYSNTGIATDFVYTAKMFFAADTMIRSGYFSKGSRILTIHTGGLQGNDSLPNGTLIFDRFSL
jgi:1-aminocyclopropane-1-carboxylate deaminase